MAKSVAKGCPRRSLLGGSLLRSFSIFFGGAVADSFLGSFRGGSEGGKTVFRVGGVVKITRRPTSRKPLKRRSKIGVFEVSFCVYLRILLH